MGNQSFERVRQAWKDMLQNPPALITLAVWMVAVGGFSAGVAWHFRQSQIDNLAAHVDTLGAHIDWLTAQLAAVKKAAADTDGSGQPSLHEGELAKILQLFDLGKEQIPFAEGSEQSRRPLVPSKRAEEYAKQISSAQGPLVEVYRAITERKFDEASQLLDEVERADEASPGRIRLARARVAMYEGMYAEAAERYDEVLEDKPDDLTVISEVALAWYYAGRLQRAEPLMRAILAMRRVAIGDEQHETIVAMRNLARVLDELGRLDEAETLARTVLQGIRSIRGEDHFETIGAMNNLTVILWEQKSPEAKMWGEATLDSATRHLGNAHRQTAQAMMNLAIILLSEGSLEIAIPMFRDVFELQRGLRGLDDKSTLNAGNNLVVALWMRGSEEDLQEAESLGRQILDSRRRVLGENHPDVAQSYNSLAITIVQDGRLVEAEPLFRDAVRIATAVLPANHPHVAKYEGGLGSCLYEQDRFEDAEPYLVSCYEKLRDGRGPGDPDTLRALETLVKLYRATGDAENERDAVDELERARQKKP